MACLLQGSRRTIDKYWDRQPCLPKLLNQFDSSLPVRLTVLSPGHVGDDCAHRQLLYHKNPQSVFCRRDLNYLNPVVAQTRDLEGVMAGLSSTQTTRRGTTVRRCGGAGVTVAV